MPDVYPASRAVAGCVETDGMRRLALAASAVCLLAAAAPSGGAPEPGPGYVKTANVTHVATIPLDAD